MTELADTHAKHPAYEGVKHTQRMPKNSLFGSNLEHLRPEEVGILWEMDAEEVRRHAWDLQRRILRGKPGFEVPDHVRDLVQRQHAAEHQSAAEQYRYYRAKAADRDARLKELEHEFKYTNIGGKTTHPLDQLEVATRGEPSYSGRPRWMTVDDLKHSGEVNCTGLTKQGNWNRDKHQPKPPVHKYALLGDPRRPGMDFDMRPADLGAIPPHLRVKPYPMVRADRFGMDHRVKKKRDIMARMGPAEHVIEKSELRIPASIKHQYGSHLCDAVLSEREKIELTKSVIQEKDQRLKHRPISRCIHPSAFPAVDPAPSSAVPLPSSDTQYEELGYATRSNVIGLARTQDHHQSSQHQAYDRRVYDQREPIPDQYRFQKDHVSKWAEANVLHERMKRALAEAQDNDGKAKA